MKRSKCNKKCEKCGKPLTFYGKDKYGQQKYRCKYCRKVLTDVKRFTSGRVANKLLGFLHKILRSNFYNKFDLSFIFKNAAQDDTKSELKNIYYNRMYRKSENKGTITINCKNPKLLICQDGDDLILYEIPNIKKNGEGEIKVIDKENFVINPESNPNYILYKNR